MAQALSSRLSRLAISSRQFMMPVSRGASVAVATSTTSSTPLTLLAAPSLTLKLGFFQSITNQSTRCLSSMMMPLKKIEQTESDYGATGALPTIPSQADAENFSAYAHANRHQKTKPFIIKRRRQNLRTFTGIERNIRHSPWRMNLICQFVAGMTVPEALKQLMFTRKSKAPLVAEMVRRTANEADDIEGLQPSQLEVAECFATHGTHLKRIKIMGRGRSGIKRRRHCHIRLVLREIDFPTKLLQAESINAKRKWLELLSHAREDYDKASAEREELAELEAMAAQLEEEAKNKEKES